MLSLFGSFLSFPDCGRSSTDWSRSSPPVYRDRCRQMRFHSHGHARGAARSTCRPPFVFGPKLHSTFGQNSLVGRIHYGNLNFHILYICNHQLKISFISLRGMLRYGTIKRTLAVLCSSRRTKPFLSIAAGTNNSTRRILLDCMMSSPIFH